MIHEIQAFDVVCLPQKNVTMMFAHQYYCSNYNFYPLMVDKHKDAKRGYFHFQYFEIKTRKGG
jgi:hypothetical protein